jgi:hypothetical protein
MDIPAILAALDQIGFDKLVCVELSRESHRADTMIPTSLEHLRSLLPLPSAEGRGEGRRTRQPVLSAAHPGCQQAD